MEGILMKKYRKYIIAVMTVLLIAVGLTACGKSTAQDLQSHQWTFASSKDNGMAATAKFSKSNLTLTQAGFSEVYTYKLIENKGNEQIKFIGKNGVSGSTETRLFKIWNLKAPRQTDPLVSQSSFQLF